MKKQKRKVVLVGYIYEENKKKAKSKKIDVPSNQDDPSVFTKEIGKFLLSIPKDLRRDIKFESDLEGFKNVSEYICHILSCRKEIVLNKNYTRKG